MARNAAPVRQLNRISFKSPLKKAARKIVTSPTFNTIKTIDFDKKIEYIKFIKFIESSNKELLKIEIPKADVLKKNIKSSTQGSGKKGKGMNPLVRFLRNLTGFNLLNWLRKKMGIRPRKWWKNLRRWTGKQIRSIKERLKKIRMDWRKWKKGIGEWRKGVIENMKKYGRNIKNSTKNWFKNAFKFVDDKALKHLREGVRNLKNFRVQDLVKHIKPPKFLTDLVSNAKNFGKKLQQAGPALKNIRNRAGGLLSKVNPFKGVKIPRIGTGGWLTLLTLIPDALKVVELLKQGRYKDASRLIITSGVSYGVFSLIFGLSGAAAILKASTIVLSPAAIAVFLGGTAAATVGGGVAGDKVDEWLKNMGLEDEDQSKSEEVKNKEIAVTNKEKSDKELEMLLDTPVKKENPVVASSKNITKSVASNNNSTKPVLNTNEKKEIKKDGIVDFKVASKSPVLEESGVTSEQSGIILVPPNNNHVQAANSPQSKIIPIPVGGGSSSMGSSFNMAEINGKLLAELQTLKLS